MMARSGGSVAHALRDGTARVLSAPAVLAGALVLTLLFSLSPDLFPFTVVVSQYTAVASLLPFGVSPYAPYDVTWLLVWSFLAGGILDRYARNRPTRGRGFFGACGAHFPGMLRLGIAEWLMRLVPSGLVQRGYSGDAAMVLFLAVGMVVAYAQVRLVVEDRRSAVGALLAGGRFIRRNAAAAAGIFLLFAAASWIANLLWPRVAQDLPGRGSLSFAEGELLIALQLFLVFASWASATALFQARLAHASYTAGPPIEWPESPAAEAITNLSPPARP